MIAEGQSTYAAFLDRVRTATAKERVLLLDYDGTLAPFNTNRDRAFPYPEVPPLLLEIIDAGTSVVLVSGRPAREVVLLSGVQPHPEIWGSHGLERLKADGEYEVAELSETQQLGLSLAADAISNEALDRHMELKPGGVAVHWRGMRPSDIERLRKTVAELWSPLVREYDLHVLDFDGGQEVRARGRDKGTAVREILREVGPDAAVAYLGDDHTDEDAFRALQGKGLTVLVRSENRATAADLWLKPPRELLEFLRAWLRASGGAA
jgi:trehalose 6-phosphate phosphatase